METTMTNKLDLMLEQLARIEARQEAVEEFIEEMTPVASAMMSAGITTFADFEQRGYFEFAKEILRAVDIVITTYSIDDVRFFTDNAVLILDTVRNITQPDVLSMIDEAADAVHDAGDAKPVGAWGMFQATKDDDVRKGMSVALEVVRQVGRAASKMQAGERPIRKPHSGPSHRPAAPTTPAAPQPAAAPAAPPTQAAPVVQAAPVKSADPGFIEDWTIEKATQIATSLGIELTAAHKTVIEWARADYIERKASPNVRRITKGSGCDTRTLYQLFPGGPGKKVARIAGIPKPGGCI